MNCELFPTATGSTHVPLSKIPCAAVSKCKVKEVFPAFNVSRSSAVFLQLVSDVWLSWGPQAPLLSDLDSETLLIMLHIDLLPRGTHTLHWLNFSHFEGDE